jgi:hypothetical protein
MDWHQYIPLMGLAMFMAGVYAFYLYVDFMVRRTERKEREQRAAVTSEPASPTKSAR